jgi:hypothetical protein
METLYQVLAFMAILPILWYEKQRWDELGQPARGGFGWNGFVRHSILIAAWPWPIGVLIAIAYHKWHGDDMRVIRLKSQFDEMSGITRRINAVNHWSL